MRGGVGACEREHGIPSSPLAHKGSPRLRPTAEFRSSTLPPLLTSAHTPTPTGDSRPIDTVPPSAPSPVFLVRTNRWGSRNESAKPPGVLPGWRPSPSSPWGLLGSASPMASTARRDPPPQASGHSMAALSEHPVGRNFVSMESIVDLALLGVLRVLVSYLWRWRNDLGVAKSVGRT